MRPGVSSWHPRQLRPRRKTRSRRHGGSGEEGRSCPTSSTKSRSSARGRIRFTVFGRRTVLPLPYRQSSPNSGRLREHRRSPTMKLLTTTTSLLPLLSRRQPTWDSHLNNYKMLKPNCKKVKIQDRLIFSILIISSRRWSKGNLRSCHGMDLYLTHVSHHRERYVTVLPKLRISRFPRRGSHRQGRTFVHCRSLDRRCFRIQNFLNLLVSRTSRNRPRIFLRCLQLLLREIPWEVSESIRWGITVT